MKLLASTTLLDRQFPVDAERQLMLLLPEDAANPQAVFRFSKMYSSLPFENLLKLAVADRLFYRGMASRHWNAIGEDLVQNPLYSRPGWFSKDMSRALAFMNGARSSPVGKTGVLMLCTHLQGLKHVVERVGDSNHGKHYPHDYEAQSCRVLGVLYTKVIRL